MHTFKNSLAKEQAGKSEERAVLESLYHGFCVFTEITDIPTQKQGIDWTVQSFMQPGVLNVDTKRIAANQRRWWADPNQVEFPIETFNRWQDGPDAGRTAGWATKAGLLTHHLVWIIDGHEPVIMNFAAIQADAIAERVWFCAPKTRTVKNDCGGRIRLTEVHLLTLAEIREHFPAWLVRP